MTSACLAKVGHQVMCIDVDADKVERLKLGSSRFTSQASNELANIAEGLGADMENVSRIGRGESCVWIA